MAEDVQRALDRAKTLEAAGDVDGAIAVLRGALAEVKAQQASSAEIWSGVAGVFDALYAAKMEYDRLQDAEARINEALRTLGGEVGPPETAKETSASVVLEGTEAPACQGPVEGRQAAPAVAVTSTRPDEPGSGSRPPGLRLTDRLAVLARHAARLIRPPAGPVRSSRRASFWKPEAQWPRLRERLMRSSLPFVVRLKAIAAVWRLCWLESPTSPLLLVGEPFLAAKCWIIQRAQRENPSLAGVRRFVEAAEARLAAHAGFPSAESYWVWLCDTHEDCNYHHREGDHPVTWRVENLSVCTDCFRYVCPYCRSTHKEQCGGLLVG